MRLYKRGKRWSVEYWVDGKRYRETTGLGDKRAAEEKARNVVREAEHEAAEGPDPHREHQKAPIARHLADFEAHLTAKGVTQIHQSERMKHLHDFVAFAEAETVRELDSVAAERWLTMERAQGSGGPVDREGPLSARSVNKRRASLRQFSRWLVTSRRSSFDVFAGLAALNELKDEQCERRAPTTEQVGAIIMAAPFERGVLYALACTTGLRRKEITLLTWGMVNLEARSLRVRDSTSKNAKEATLPLHPLAEKGLRELLRRREAGESTRGGGHYSEPEPVAGPTERVFNGVPTMVTVRRDLKKLDIPYRTSEGKLDFHAIGRYGFATLLGRAGVPLAQAQKLMRHSTPMLTAEVYTRFNLGDAREAVESLGGGWTAPAEWGDGNCGCICVSNPSPPPTTLQLHAPSTGDDKGCGESSKAPAMPRLEALQAMSPSGFEPETVGLEGRCSIH